MQQKIINVYPFEELGKYAQERVLEKFRYINVEDEVWYEPIIEYYKKQLEQHGFTDIEISFTGFYSQGDGASFTGKIDLVKWLTLNQLTEKYTKAYQYVQSVDRYRTDIFEIKRIDNYYHHEKTCRLDLDTFEPCDYNGEYTPEEDGAINKELEEIQPIIETERLEWCKKIYKSLRDTYESLTEDSALKEMFDANNFLFTEYGELFTN